MHLITGDDESLLLGAVSRRSCTDSSATAIAR